MSLAALWTVALAAYAGSFGAGLVFDNRLLIPGDPRIQAATQQNIALILGRDYWFGHWNSDLYRPLTTLSYLFNYSVLGNASNPAGYHWVNFALHAVNIALVYVLALWILGELRTAWAMTAVWAVHPVLTESITNVVGRADLLAACGVLAALVCHIQASRAAGRRRMRWLLALALAVALGMFSKESAIVAPAVMLLYDLAFHRRSAWRPRIANYAAAIVPCLLFLYVRAGVLGQLPSVSIPFTDNPLTGVGFWTARLTALRVIGQYVALLFWPASLSADYSYSQIPLFHAGDPAALAALAVCAVLAAAAIWTFRRSSPIFFFVGWFFVTLAPVSNVFLLIGTIMAERFLYLPALGLAGCVAIGLRAASQRWPGRAAPILLAAVCIAFAVRTFVRNQDWATEQSLMTSAAQSAPAAFRPHTILATLLSGSAAAAQADQTRAILDSLPDNLNSVQAYISVGIAYRAYGDALASKSPAEAGPWFRKSLDALLRARSIEQIYGRVYQQENLRRGKGKIDFDLPEVHMELGRAYLRLSQPREALEEFQRGRHLTLHPQFFFEEISNAYRASGDSRQSAIALIEGVLLNDTEPPSPAVNAYKTQLSARLVDLYRQTDPRSCAVREAGGIRSIDMGCPLVKEHVCAALREVSREYPAKGIPEDCPVL
jgi:tetratricopeptide (TPR) repeat protein